MVNATTSQPSDNMTRVDILTSVATGAWHAFEPADAGSSPAGSVAEEKTMSGIPVRYLWVPYVALGVILVSLMLASFLRYHQKHGHKYQQRRAELWRRFNMEKLMEQINHMGEGTTSAVNSLLPPNGGLHFPSHSTSSKKENTKDSSSKKKRKKHRKPLVFYTNNNGSMVDVRCNMGDTPKTEPAESEQLSCPLQPQPHSSELTPRPSCTLPLLPGISPGASSSGSLKQKSPVLWTLTRPSQSSAGSAVWTPASFFSSPMDIQLDEIEAEDDDVLLLQEL